MYEDEILACLASSTVAEFKLLWCRFRTCYVIFDTNLKICCLPTLTCHEALQCSVLMLNFTRWICWPICTWPAKCGLSGGWWRHRWPGAFSEAQSPVQVLSAWTWKWQGQKASWPSSREAPFGMERRIATRRDAHTCKAQKTLFCMCMHYPVQWQIACQLCISFPFAFCHCCTLRMPVHHKDTMIGWMLSGDNQIVPFQFFFFSFPSFL